MIYRNILIAQVVIAAIVGCYFAYVSSAFPEVRCEAAKHLVVEGEEQPDCYDCHVKATPKQAQFWYESKHGVLLVRCPTCHSLPDGTGTTPFNPKPGKDVCVRCHGPAVEKMEAKFGRNDNCNSCHPNHHSPLHSDVFQFKEATTVTE